VAGDDVIMMADVVVDVIVNNFTNLFWFLPEFLILKKVMKTKLLLIFFEVVGLAIMILGHFFNAVLDTKNTGAYVRYQVD